MQHIRRGKVLTSQPPQSSYCCMIDLPFYLPILVSIVAFACAHRPLGYDKQGCVLHSVSAPSPRTPHAPYLPLFLPNTLAHCRLARPIPSMRIVDIQSLLPLLLLTCLRDYL
jgi:hypothetical protein